LENARRRGCRSGRARLQRRERCCCVFPLMPPAKPSI
jgi:hypothetical protein